MANISRRRFFYFGAASSALAASCTTAPVNPVATAKPASTQSYEGSLSFDHGIASGDATSNSVILWTRLSPDTQDAMIEGMVFASTDRTEIESLTEIEAGSLKATPISQKAVFSTSAARDFTVKIDLGGLNDAAHYYYAFAVETSEGIKVSPIGQTKTLPATGTAPFRAAIVSCSNLPFGFFNAYDAIAKRDDLDAVIHLGDYIYEYGREGYGGAVGAKIGREVEPAHEIVKLADYRTRHAQYKSDPALQAAHASKVWYCAWDDHESTNDSYRTGAQNHQPDTEGEWSVRKAEAVQAYLEWMPVRDPVAGAPVGSIYRAFDIGDLATLTMLESRLLGRSDELTYNAALELPKMQQMLKVQEILAEAQSPSRTMLGETQEKWLAKAFETSVKSGKKWQVLGNQVIMAKVNTPNVSEALTDEEKQALSEKSAYAGRLVEFSKYGLPWNLDAWDGFAAARERLYTSAKAAGARLVTLTGDTHTAWANELHDAAGDLRGVEFGCTSITSPGLGAYLPLPTMGQLMADKNDDVHYFDPFGHGFTILQLDENSASGEFVKVSDILKPEYTVESTASFQSEATASGMTPLSALRTTNAQAAE